MRRVERTLSITIGLIVAGCGDNHKEVPDAAPAIDAPGDTVVVPPMISVTFTNPPATPSTFKFLVAYQDGTGPWMAAPAPTGDTYSIPISSLNYGVAWTCLSPGLREVTAYYFSKAERSTLTIPVPDRCTDRAPIAVALSGTVSNRPVAGAMAAAFGPRASDVNTTTGTYSIPTAPGTHDLIVGHALVGGGNAVMDMATVQRGLAVNAGTTANVDFATAMMTRTAVVSVGAPVTARVNVRTQLQTSNGTALRLVDANTAPYPTRGLAAAQAQTGDVYNIQILVAEGGQTAITQSWLAEVAATTYVAPTPFGAAPTTVVSSTPYPLIKTTWAPYANALGYSWSGAQSLTAGQCGGAACTVTWTTNVSPAAAGMTPDNHMPELAGLTGWDPDLQFRTGVSVAGYVNALTSTAGPMDFPLALPAAAGTKRVFVAADWIATP
jgi:hypothetical protein